ncbi:hypothetical protein KR093_008284, partial [Drosophila rubida]
RLLLDIVLLALLLALSEHLRDFAGEATKRGFYCDDESLMYPYKDNTVSPDLLHWLSFYLPLAAIVLLESYRCWTRCRAAATASWLHYWPVYNTLRWFLFGHAAESLLKDMSKQLIGRLRPHFFDLCQPRLADGGFCSDEQHRAGGIYHTVYSCSSNASAKLLRDVHVSFPSGHSSMAFYGLVFMALYLQTLRLPSTLLRPVCQLLCVGLAAFVGLSRVMDYKHHWSDVVAGSLLGASVALAVVRGAAQQHRLRPQASVEAAPAAVVEAPEQLTHDLCEVACHSSN